MLLLPVAKVHVQERCGLLQNSKTERRCFSQHDKEVFPPALVVTVLPSVVV